MRTKLFLISLSYTKNSWIIYQLGKNHSFVAGFEPDV